MRNVLILLLVSSFLTIITTPTFAYVREERPLIGAYNGERPLGGGGYAEERRDAMAADKGEFSGEF